MPNNRGSAKSTAERTKFGRINFDTTKLDTAKLNKFIDLQSTGGRLAVDSRVQIENFQ